MNSAIAVVEKGGAVAAFTPDREKVELIKQTVARGCSDVELELFLYTAKRTGLDPLLKQIYAIKRWDSNLGKEAMTIQTGIDGFRVVASRTGKLAGIEDATFEESNGQPVKATVTVYKLDEQGQPRPYTASARMSEYQQTKKDGTLTSFWKRMPFGQLGKCAEALALRKAFPADLSGVYSFEEMNQADSQTEISEAEAKLLCADCHKEVDAYSFVDKNEQKQFITLEKVKEAAERDFPGVNLCGGCQVKRHAKKRKGDDMVPVLEASVVRETLAREPVDVLAIEESVDKALDILCDDKEGRAEGIIHQVYKKDKKKPFMVIVESATNPDLKRNFSSFHESHQDAIVGHEGQRVILWYEVSEKSGLTYRNIKEIESVDGKPVTSDEPF